MACVPYVTVQHDYPQVFDEISQGVVAAERVWISIYALNAPNASIHSRILLVSDEPEAGPLSIPTSDADGGGGVYIAEVKPEKELGVKRVKGSPKSLVVSSTFRPAEDSIAPSPTSARHIQQKIYLPPVTCLSPSHSISMPKVAPLQLRKGVTPEITAFDVSLSNNGLYVAGGPDGKCWIGALPGSAAASSQSGGSAPLVVLDGHVGDITSAKFFPSGEVVMTTGSDFRICIFSALPAEGATASSSTIPATNSAVRTLTAHSRAPTSTAIIGKGRIVLSGGRDGYVRCWNVGEAKEVGNLAASEAVTSSLFPPTIERILLGPDPSTKLEASSGEEETDLFPGRFPLLAIALNSGEVVLHDLRRCSLSHASASDSDPRSKPLRIQPFETLRTLLPPPSFPPGPPLDASDAAQAWASTRSGAASALAWDHERHLLVIGYARGLVAVHRVSELLSDESSEAQGTAPAEKNSLVALWKRNEATITQIELVPSTAQDEEHLRMVVTTSDGLAATLSLDTSSTPAEGSTTADSEEKDSLRVPCVLTEYIGWESGDTINSARVVSNEKGSSSVVLAGAGGLIRLYRGL
ncbi:hypothetical protein OC846_000465 [Tilletia horrida]|uniref:WD40 repeat-like protein n=1 Tax=Tilletia horrida TaxID=155126 RepID=A0AAN6JUI6_9BASI|nr:hypothetical protein OC846_000465 [Tilletia horrida]KAK0567907.1 hypothetical protein OC861_002467 [Tilletia horrida]